MGEKYPQILTKLKIGGHWEWQKYVLIVREANYDWLWKVDVFRSMCIVNKLIYRKHSVPILSEYHTRYQYPHVSRYKYHYSQSKLLGFNKFVTFLILVQLYIQKVEHFQCQTIIWHSRNTCDKHYIGQHTLKLWKH